MTIKSFDFKEEELRLPISVNGATYYADVSAQAAIRYQNLSQDLAQLIVDSKAVNADEEQTENKKSSQEVQQMIEDADKELFAIFFDAETLQHLNMEKLPRHIYQGIIDYVTTALFPDEDGEDEGK
ncbi:hypothetical protein [Listeria booriae]|uniref:Phage protein n=1 Tax=Listeria booriae TaxID=1552123 RepID=A0A842ESY7_9LIST|nr:hypothetical protein [Listeria booriae]MBC1801125.1 hypothetical protein [Listeria booriae]MBC2239754.1 hypothetical protein [Listeria booriae]